MRSTIGKISITMQNDVDKYVEALMQSMTLEEKIGQTAMHSSAMDITGPVLTKEYRNYIKKGKVGAIFNATGVSFIKKLQKIAVEETRLGIPLLFAHDIIHGYKTIFPTPLAESCSWDLKLIEKTARVAAVESSAAGIHWVFAPMIDISRDPRWGRIMEGAGEDPYLGGLIAKARVRGFQADLKKDTSVLACAKHFAGYGAVQAGRDYHTVDMSEIRLRNTYLPPFKMALDEGVATFMTAFNELNGIPATGNKFLLDKILRKEWKFKGLVVSDYVSINEMIPHGFASDLKHAGELAINAGVDMDMQGNVYNNYLKQSIEEEKVSIEQIDKAVRNILKLKYKLGLFDDPYKYCNENREKELILSKKHLEIAKESALKSIVLLKNDKATLPFDKSKKIALIGPFADDDYHILGAWVAEGHNSDQIVSVKKAFEKENLNFDYAKGCEITGGNKNGFESAVKIAEKSDIVVMVLGEPEYMSGENNSRSNLKLPGLQQALIKAIKKTGKPIVLVLFNGRPLDLSWEDQNIESILNAWHPGTKGGEAIVELLLGQVNPSGKLSISFPRNVGQIPIYYNQKNTGRPDHPGIDNKRYVTKYIDVENSPLYPFGHGLSYTTFKYSNLQLDSDLLTDNIPITASINVTNTGNYDGEEIVQLYIRDVVGSITRPIKELKGFDKIFLRKGETKKVNFTISAEILSFFDGVNYVTEEGVYEIFIAGNSNHEFKHKFNYKTKTFINP